MLLVFSFETSTVHDGRCAESSGEGIGTFFPAAVQMSVCCPACVLQEHCLTWGKGSSASWSPWLRICLRESVMLVLVLTLFGVVWRLYCPELCHIINSFSFHHICVSWYVLCFHLVVFLGTSVAAKNLLHLKVLISFQSWALTIWLRLLN